MELVLSGTLSVTSSRVASEAPRLDGLVPESMCLRTDCRPRNFRVHSRDCETGGHVAVCGFCTERIGLEKGRGTRVEVVWHLFADSFLHFWTVDTLDRRVWSYLGEVCTMAWWKCLRPSHAKPKQDLCHGSLFESQRLGAVERPWPSKLSR